MTGILLAAGAALGADAGADCSDPAERTAAAWAQYGKAEVEAARQEVAAGHAALLCQTAVVTPRTLLELYWLDALVALSADDKKAMVYATLRAIAADHVGGRPPADYGPDLQSVYDTWLVRMQEELLDVTVVGGGAAWVDGREVTSARPLQVVEGEHLVQLPGPDGTVVSRIEEWSGDQTVATGLPGGAPSSVPEPIVDPDPVLEPHQQPVLPEPVPVARSRQRPLGLVLATGAAVAVAGVALGSAWRSEQIFDGSSYLAKRYGRCSYGEPCYRGLRADAIREDARRIDLAYGVGYAASAASAGLLVVTVVGVRGE
jgi:hypothetical protein